jgi:hypothetical protein
MNLKLLTVLLCAGIAVLLGSTAFVATLPASSPAAKPRPVVRALPEGWTSATSGSAHSLPPSTTEPPSASTTQPAPPPPSTAFVLVTITYQVKKGDTVSSISNWFGRHGFAVQFAANLQVIEDNQDLLVPGALISISNGVMTIHSPV